MLVLENSFAVPTLFSPGGNTLLNYIISWIRIKDSVTIIKNKQTDLPSNSLEGWKPNIHVLGVILLEEVLIVWGRDKGFFATWIAMFAVYRNWPRAIPKAEVGEHKV